MPVADTKPAATFLGVEMNEAKLPLPVAFLCRRARNAKSPKERHDAAYFAWEASIRLAAAVSLRPDITLPSAPSVGTFVDLIARQEDSHTEAPLLGVHDLFMSVTDQGGSRRRTSSGALLRAVPVYRNAVIGHGSVRTGTYYEAAGHILLDGLVCAWEQGVFWNVAARLMYVDGLEVSVRGDLSPRLLDLGGAASTLVVGEPPCEAQLLSPGTVVLIDGAKPRSLHPWVLYKDDGLRERLLLFNGRTRSARYLDFASGEELRGRRLDEEFPGIERDLDGRVASTRVSVPSPVSEPNQIADYRVVGKLGEGGMASVLLARQESLDRVVALKVLPSEMTKDAVAVARFEREVAALARCDHPNVVKVLSSGRSSTTHYYSMELVDGVDLARLSGTLSSSATLDSAVAAAYRAMLEENPEVAQVLPGATRHARSEKPQPTMLGLAVLFRDAARALAHIHEQGILHRDIKPSNLMVTMEDLRLVVMDLGLAAVANASRSLTKTHTSLIGTLRYVAPEQLQRSLMQVDGRADIYSLGATFYELLTGQPLHRGDDEAQLVRAIIFTEPAVATKANPAVPADLALILQKTTHKDPRERYETASALALDLEAFCEGRPVAARPPTLGYVLRLAIRRHKTAAAASLATLLLIVVVVIYAFVAIRSERDVAESAYLEAVSQRALTERVTGDVVTARALAAFALAHRERPDVRGIVVASSNAWLPEIRGVGRVDPGGCRSLVFDNAGAAICAGNDAVVTLDSAGRVVQRNRAPGVTVLAWETASARLFWGRSDGAVLQGFGDHAVVAAGHQHEVLALTTSGDGTSLAISYRGGRVEIVDLANGESRSIRERGPDVHALAFDPVGDLLAFGDEDGNITVADAMELTPATTLEQVHRDGVLALTFTPDGNLLVSGGDDSLLVVMQRDTSHADSRSFTRARALRGHDASIHGVRLVPGHPHHVATVSRDRTLRLWSLETGREEGQVPAGLASLRSLAASPLGIATSSDDGEVRFWRLAPFAATGVEGHQGDVTAVAFLPRGDAVVSTSIDGTVRQWRLPFLSLDRSVELGGEGWSLGVSGDRVFVGTSGAGGRHRGEHQTQGGKPRIIAYSEDGERLWVHDAPLEIARVRALTASSDGGLVVAAGGTSGEAGPAHAFLHFLARDGTPARPHAQAHDAWVYDLELSHDQRRIATASRDGSVRIWDVVAARWMGEPLRHPGWVTGVVFTNDDRRVVTSCEDGLLRVWDLASGRVEKFDAGHHGWVLGLALSPDGTTIASGGEDFTVRLWSLESRSELATLHGHTQMVWTVAFSPDGTLLVSGGRDRYVRVWKLQDLRTPGTELLHGVEDSFAVTVEGGRVVPLRTD